MQDDMQLNLALLPDLEKDLSAILTLHTRAAHPLSKDELLVKVQEHLEKIRMVAQSNPIIHLSLVEALAQTYEHLGVIWNKIPSHIYPWLKGAMYYFINPDDEDHDFESPIGFEDDVEVLNACLRLGDLETLCLNPEDFD